MGWGATLSGLSAVESTLDGVEEQWGNAPTWVVGTNVEYAVHVEFGTSSQEAQSHLRDAVKQTMRSDADRLADEASSADELIEMIAHTIERRTKELAPVDTGTLKASYKAERVD